MDQAAKHLPPDAVRPALILFTDGRHDVRGVPAGQVRVVRDRLFGSRSPFALLPVGMGLDPTKRDALENGLVGMRVVSDMPPCVSGSTFDWPQVVFDSPADAGNAVAVALQNATCTFTVEPPPAVPAPTVGAVRGVQLTARDGAIALSWAPPVATSASAPVVDYRARCRADAGEWIEADEGVSLETTAIVDGLTNGVAYRCEVTAVGSASEGTWTAATTAVAPMARPAAPGKPSVEAFDRSLRISVTPAAAPGVSAYRYECSGDGGATWSHAVEVGSVDTTAQIGGLTNGAQYICRAYAANAVGMSGASAVSDAVMPCGSAGECNPLLQPILGILGVVLAGRGTGGLRRPVPGAKTRVRRRSGRCRSHRQPRTWVAHGYQIRSRPGQQAGHRDRCRSRSETGHPCPPTPRGPLRGDRQDGPPRHDVRRAGRCDRSEGWTAPARLARIRHECGIHGVGPPLTSRHREPPQRSRAGRG